MKYKMKWFKRIIMAWGLFWLILVALIFYDAWTIWRRFKEWGTYA